MSKEEYEPAKQIPCNCGVMLDLKTRAVDYCFKCESFDPYTKIILKCDICDSITQFCTFCQTVAYIPRDTIEGIVHKTFKELGWVNEADLK